MRSLGWWRCCGRVTGSPSAPLLLCPRSPSPIRLMPPLLRGKALEREVLSLVEKGAVELAPLPSPGFYSCLFVVMKASGSWRPVIDLSTLNLRVLKSPFKIETLHSILLSVSCWDWMVSLDFQDAYLHVPVHPNSRKFLRFVALGQVFQFKALCFSLSTAPQVFMRVMAPVSAFLHREGVRIRRCLDDRLVQAPSRDPVLCALDSVLRLCWDLGIVVNRAKSHLVPSQRIVYRGMVLDSLSFRASPTQLAGASRGSFVSDSSGSRGPPPHAVSPAPSQLVVGSAGRLRSGPVG